VIKSKITGEYGYVECMVELKNLYRIVVGKAGWKNHLGDLVVDGRKILKYSLKK
jgi:hypothetical protein